MTKKIALAFTMLVAQMGLFSSQALSSSSAVTVKVSDDFEGLGHYNKSKKVLRVHSDDVNDAFRVYGSIVEGVPTINVEKYVADDENPALTIRRWNEHQRFIQDPSPVSGDSTRCSYDNAQLYCDLATFSRAVILENCLLKIHNGGYHICSEKIEIGRLEKIKIDGSERIKIGGKHDGGCNFEMGADYAAVTFSGPSKLSASPHAHLLGALTNNLQSKYASRHEGGTSELNPLKSVVLKSNGRLANSNPRQFDTVLRGCMEFGDAMVFDLTCLGGELTFNFG